MIGKVIINVNGEKVINFDDAAWEALPVGATIYSAGNGELEREAKGRSNGARHLATGLQA